MKNRFRSTLCVLCMAAMALAQTNIIPIIGYTRVDIPPAGGVNLVGFNYTSENPLYLENVFGTNQLVQVQSNVESAFADRVYVWNGSGYDGYYQQTDGLFHDAITKSNATTTIQSGTALFIQGSAFSSQTNTIVLMGAVEVTDLETQAYNGGGSLTAIANPYPTDLDLNGTNVNWFAATSHAYRADRADNVYIWNPEKAGGAGWDSYYLDADDDKWHNILGGALGNAVIPAGGGAFYKARNTFTNDVVRPFSL